LEECFTLNRLGVPPSLHRCLATTNRIESPQAGVRRRTRRVCRWRDAAMILRWVAASFLAAEKNFRRIMGWKDLWQLKIILQREELVTRAVLRLLYAITAVPEPSGSVIGGDGLDNFSDCLFQGLRRAGFGGTQQLLQLRPSLLNGVEIG
jgi:hypothetical protein